MSSNSIGNVHIDGNENTMYKQCFATPSPNYDFVNWEGDSFLNKQLTEIKEDNPINVVLNDYSSNKIIHDISACFSSKIQYTINAILNDTSAGQVTGVGSKIDENSFTLRAIPNDGYSFKEWDGDVIPYSIRNNPEINIILDSADPYQTINAIFEQDGIYTTFEYTDGRIEQKLIEGIFTIKHTTRNTHTYNETTIKKITLGLAVTTIDNYACANCIELEEVLFTTIDQTIILNPYAFYNDNKLDTFDFSRISNNVIPDYAFYNTKFSTLIFDNIINEIGNYAFAECKQLVTINIQNTIKKIGDYAFSNCENLQIIDLLKINESFGIGSFMNTKINSIASFDSRILIIPEYCFYGCQYLVSLTLPTTIKTLGNNAFNMCHNLTNINLRAYESEIPDIYENTFNNVSDVPTRKFYFKSINESLIAYANGAWKLLYGQFDPQATLDTQLVFAVQNTSSQIQFTVFANNKTIDIDYGDGKTDTFTIQNTKTIKHLYSSNKTYTMKIIGDLTSITCNSKFLKSVDSLSYTITTINTGAFKNSGIESLSIPATITSIGKNILDGCDNININNITIYGGSIITDYWGVLSNRELIELFDATSATSFNALNSNLKILPKECFNTCQKITSIQLPQSLQTISLPIISTNGFNNLSQLIINENNQYFSVINGMLISNDGQIVLTVKTPGAIPITTSTIQTRAFTNTSLTTLTIPANITSIYRQAFCNNMNLRSIYVPFSINDTINKLQNNKWFYGGVRYTTRNNDQKKQAANLIIQCSNGQLPYVLITNEPGYIKNELQPNKVKVLTISLDYSGNNELKGMTNDSDRFESLLNGFSSSIEKIKNRDATISNVKNKLQAYVDNSHDDELFIFHFSGHGGGGSNGKSHMCLYDGNLQDSEFWEIIQNIKGRVMAIFCCCHAGTMFQAIASLDNNDINNYISNISQSSSWAQSAIKYFNRKKTILNFSSPTDIISNDSIEDESEDNQNIIYDDESTIQMIVYSACKDNEASWMDPSDEPAPDGSVGHTLMTSIINNFNASTKLDSYYSLFINSTTNNEDAAKDRYDDTGKLRIITPQMTILGGFDSHIRAFT